LEESEEMKTGLLEKMLVRRYGQSVACIPGKAYRDLSAHEWHEVGSIAVQRHFTLNWLCGYAPENRWDETPTDT